MIDSKRKRSAVLSFASPNGLREPTSGPDVLDRATLLGHYIVIAVVGNLGVFIIEAPLGLRRSLYSDLTIATSTFDILTVCRVHTFNAQVTY